MFKNKKCDVLGAGVSNTPLIGYLLDEGAEVTVRDSKTLDKLGDGVKQYEGRVKFVLGDGYLDGIDGDYIFRSPGIRPDAGSIPEAVGNGSVLTSEMELFFDLCPAKIVAITGSDGKTTSTTLASLFLAAEYGENHVYVGGNIGQPLLPRVKDMTENDFAVVELSSFQLMTMKKAPDIAIITNITPNHLNWHTGMDEYTRAKENVFLNMKPGQRIVLNSRDKVSREIVGDVPEGVETLFFAGKGTFDRDGIICREGKEIMPVSDIFIRGRHNVENYEGVIAALGDMVSADKIAKIAREFKGVEHRIEYVRTHKGVEYYNSSIDSTPTRTAACLLSFDEKVIVICCGRDKHLPLDPLLDALEKKAKAAVVSGEAMDLIGDAVEKARAEGRKMPPCTRIKDFDGAVKYASGIAKEGDTVVLSPACTSFDAFKNFEERGKRFKKIIMELE